jgi:hypothetical protein
LKENLEGVNDRRADKIKVNFEEQKSEEARVETELIKNSKLPQDISELKATNELNRVKRQEQPARAREFLVAASFGDLDSLERGLQQINLWNTEIKSQINQLRCQREQAEIEMRRDEEVFSFHTIERD